MLKEERERRKGKTEETAETAGEKKPAAEEQPKDDKKPDKKKAKGKAEEEPKPAEKKPAEGQQKGGDAAEKKSVPDEKNEEKPEGTENDVKGKPAGSASEGGENKPAEGGLPEGGGESEEVKKLRKEYEEALDEYHGAKKQDKERLWKKVKKAAMRLTLALHPYLKKPSKFGLGRKKNEVTPKLFLTDKKALKEHPSLNGVHHENGFAIVTDSYRLLAVKTDYPKEWEGKTFDLKGNEVDGFFPDWTKALPEEELVSVGRGVFLKAAEDMEAYLKEHKDVKLSDAAVQIGGRYYPADTVKALAEVLKASDTAKLKVNKNGTLHVEGDGIHAMGVSLTGLPDGHTLVAKAEEHAEKNPSLGDVISTLYGKGKDFASRIFNMKFFDFAKTPDFMKRLGITGSKFTIRYGVIARHFGKDGSHDFTKSEWEQLPRALENPFAITRLADKEKGFRIYTTLKTEKGEYVVVGVDVKNAGRDVEVNAISTVFGRRNGANLTKNEEVVYRSEMITPEQESLLSRPNSDQYPPERELSESKDSASGANAQAGSGNSAAAVKEKPKTKPEKNEQPQETADPFNAYVEKNGPENVKPKDRKKLTRLAERILGKTHSHTEWNAEHSATETTSEIPFSSLFGSEKKPLLEAEGGRLVIHDRENKASYEFEVNVDKDGNPTSVTVTKRYSFGAKETKSERTAPTDAPRKAQPLTPRARKVMEGIAKALGVDGITWEETADYNGMYDSKDGSLHISMDADRALDWVFGHESLHRIRDLNDTAYLELRDAVAAVIGNREFAALVNGVKALYAKYGRTISNEGAEEEAVADCLGGIVHENELLEKIASRLRHPILSRLRDVASRLLDLFRLHGMTEQEKAMRNLQRAVDRAYAKAAKEAKYRDDAAVRDSASGEASGVKYSLRSKPAPKKTVKVYKLMRLGDDGKLYPLYIDSAEPLELHKWYDADSPALEDLKGLESGDYFVDNKTGEAMPFDEFKEAYGAEIPRLGSKPNPAAINWATENGGRFIHIADKSKGQNRYGGEPRSYFNLGVNGANTVSQYAMRPGWHAGSLPTMRQIGKGPGKNLRDDEFVWVEGEIPADIDYNAEAQKNSDRDIPDHIPTDGYYLKATNADKVKSQADKVGWYVAGAFKPDRVISDAEARSAIDKFNEEHPGAGGVEYDYEREGGKPFSEEDAAKANGEKYSLRDGSFLRSGSYFSGGGLLEEGLKDYLDPKVAVEFNKKISGVYRDNFGNHIVTADVRDVDPKKLVKDIDGPVQYFHASPVCKNFSTAKRDAGEVELDKDTAKSTAYFIEKVRPKVVTIENVKGYKNSEALKIITDELTRQGYDWDADVYNAADYGGYTKRERLIVRAVRDGELPPKPKPLPESQRKHGWMEAVSDLVDSLPEKESGVPKWMDERLKGEGIDWRDIDKPLYVFGQGNSRTSIPHAFADELLPTLRTKGGDVIIMPDGRVLKVTPRVLARVTGLADDYEMPKTDDLAHTVVGNGIPAQLSENVVGPLLADVFNGGEPAKKDGSAHLGRKEDDGKKYSLIGKRGAEQADRAEEVTTRLDNLSVAREMEAGKKDAKAIKLATGWERGADGKWRYEIPDLKLKGTEGKHLADWIDAPDLFKAYPKLKSVSVKVKDMPPTEWGSYNGRSNTITVNSKLKDASSVLAHEVQHAIQHAEGFERGGNLTDTRKTIENIIADNQDASDYAKNKLKKWATMTMEADRLVDLYKAYINSGDPRLKEKAVEAYWDAMNELDNNESSTLANDYPDGTATEIAESGYHVEEAEKELRRLAKDAKDSIPEGNMSAMELVAKLSEALENRSDNELYHSLGGEVEARNVEKRMGMTPEERHASLAAETEDVARKDQIFLTGGGDDAGQKFSLRDKKREGEDIEHMNESDEENSVRPRSMMSALVKAANTIKGWVLNNKRDGLFSIELPKATQRMISKVMGRDFDSHNITANSIAHIQKNHGVNGRKISSNSIPLRDVDMELIPYIMVAPDYVRKGSTDTTGRTSIRFYKNLSNGYVVVAEKEYKNSPHDMETITMWAEKSDKATNARLNAAPDTHVQNAILDIDAAKIREDAEMAIENDKENDEQKQSEGRKFSLRHPFGGNSGYVGYSMSKRAAQAREDGRYPKTDFRKEYSVTPKTFDALVNAGIIDGSEWHHTSMYGNKTPFYGWKDQAFADTYASHKGEIDKMVSSAMRANIKNPYPIDDSRSNGYLEAMRTEDKRWDEDMTAIEKKYGYRRGYGYPEDVHEQAMAEVQKVENEHKAREAAILRQYPEDAQKLENERKHYEWEGDSARQQETRKEQLADDLRSFFEDGGGDDAGQKFSLRDKKREGEDIERVNDEFNKRLDELSNGQGQKGGILHLGHASQFLKDGGMADAEIVLEYDKLRRKSSIYYKNKHPYNAVDLKDLPLAIANPIAVFGNTNDKDSGNVILTELKKEGRNFIVAVRTEEQNRKGGLLVKVNQITTLFPKEAKGIINWFNLKKATNINKEKALRFIEALQTHPGTTIKDEELSDAAKVINDYNKSNSESEKFSLRGESKNGYDPRANIAPVRGEWTKDKIIKRLKDMGGARTGYSFAAKLISEFDSPEELAEHMYYHGTARGGGSLKPSILFNDRDLDSYGGGGYGERYWGVSLSKSKRVSSNFSGTSRRVSIYPVILAKNAKVKDMPQLADASELDDVIVDLWKDGVDAVRIGDWNDKYSEQELCVINPRAIVNIDNADYYKAFGLGTDKNPLHIIDKAGIEKLYDDAKRFEAQKGKQPRKPLKPSRYYTLD